MHQFSIPPFSLPLVNIQSNVHLCGTKITNGQHIDFGIEREKNALQWNMPRQFNSLQQPQLKVRYLFVCGNVFSLRHLPVLGMHSSSQTFGRIANTFNDIVNCNRFLASNFKFMFEFLWRHTVSGDSAAIPITHSKQFENETFHRWSQLLMRYTLVMAFHIFLFGSNFVCEIRRTKWKRTGNTHGESIKNVSWWIFIEKYTQLVARRIFHLSLAHFPQLSTDHTSTIQMCLRYLAVWCDLYVPHTHTRTHCKANTLFITSKNV